MIYICGYDNGRILVFDVDTKSSDMIQILYPISTFYHTTGIKKIAFHPDKLFVTVYDNDNFISTYKKDEGEEYCYPTKVSSQKIDNVKFLFYNWNGDNLIVITESGMNTVTDWDLSVCLPPKIIDLVTNSCLLLSCPPRTYLDVITSLCKPCGKKCLTCDEPDKCTSCPNGRSPKP